MKPSELIFGIDGQRHRRKMQPRNGRLSARIPIDIVGPGQGQPDPNAGIKRCEYFVLGVCFVENCLVDYAQTCYMPGFLTNGDGYGIWDLERRGGPVEVFAPYEETVYLRVQELILDDPRTTEVLRWIRRERASRPW
jgi:hypothetical protein